MATKSFKHFNPLPPCGGRPNLAWQYIPICLFQSTPSVWRETENEKLKQLLNQFQSTPSVWRETGSALPRATRISDFNPLPPCGGRQKFLIPLNTFSPFQSTPSVWRETGQFNAVPPDGLFQSTPSVWRETGTSRQKTCLTKISIHSLRVEGDLEDVLATVHDKNFNPLPPCGGRHAMQDLVMFRWCISIHSLRVEGDPDLRWCPIRRKHFNPLPPCGGRLYRPCFQVPM